jgi:DNA-binding MarR family transcriptional regulator
MTQTSPIEVAQRTLEIIPLVMQVMAVEMRAGNTALLPGQFRVMVELTARPYALGELAEQVGVSSPTMSNTITALENRGWLRRVRSNEDRRQVFVELAPAGRQVLDEMEQHMQLRLSEFLADLDEEKQVLIIDALTVLRDAFAAGLERQRRSTQVS